MIRMLLVGYCYGIRHERRLCHEVALHLAYRWFCKLDLDDKVPHHSTFSVNRLGRFRESEMLRQVFERVVAACMAAGLVKGEGFAVDASVMEANASRYRDKAPAEGGDAMAKCETCGHDYDKAFQVTKEGQVHTYDSFECAIHALAPTCAACGIRIIGHGLEKDGMFFCCDHCAVVAACMAAGLVKGEGFAVDASVMEPAWATPVSRWRPNCFQTGVVVSDPTPNAPIRGRL